MGAGLVPAFADADSVLLGAGIIGATVMPHACVAPRVPVRGAPLTGRARAGRSIYLHSSLTRERVPLAGAPAALDAAKARVFGCAMAARPVRVPCCFSVCACWPAKLRAVCVAVLDV